MSEVSSLCGCLNRSKALDFHMPNLDYMFIWLYRESLTVFFLHFKDKTKK